MLGYFPIVPHLAAAFCSGGSLGRPRGLGGSPGARLRFLGLDLGTEEEEEGSSEEE